MVNFFNKVLDVIAGWLFRPKKKDNCKCCRDKAKHDEEQKEKKEAGVAY